MLELTALSLKVSTIHCSGSASQVLSSFAECNDTDVRLVQLDGDVEGEGLVEYCSSGRWGLVCFDSWDTNDARVICRQLGYDVESKITIILILPQYYETSHRADKNVLATEEKFDGRVTYLMKVLCIGTENKINECTHDDSHTCINPSAGVVCPNGE